MRTRSTSITVLGWVFICVGCGSCARGVVRFVDDAGVAAHASLDLSIVLASGAMAAAAGILLVRGSNWGRWLCATWMGAHVVISLLHSMTELAVHALFFAMIVFLLWRPPASAHFESASL